MTDREEIIDLVARFADAISRQDFAVFGTLWAPDANWIIDPPLDAKMAGSGSDLAAAFEAGTRAMWTSFLQLVHQTVVDLGPDSATARSYITEQGVRTDGVGQRLHGVYEDELVRTTEGWKFKVRHFKYLYLDNEPIPGLSALGGELKLPVAARS